MIATPTAAAAVSLAGASESIRRRVLFCECPGVAQERDQLVNLPCLGRGYDRD